MGIFEIIKLVKAVRPIIGEVDDIVEDRKISGKEIVELVDVALKQFIGVGLDKIYFDMDKGKIIIDKGDKVIKIETLEKK